MNALFEIIRAFTNLALTLVFFMLLVLIYSATKTWLKKRELKKKGNLYIAIQLTLDNGTEKEKKEITKLDLFELDNEISKIVKESLLVKSTARRILKSKLSSIHKYYLTAVNEGLFEKERAKYQVKN